jgi:glucosamine--fructose-6-phosphate aminotransferase (isomerizing)
MVHPYKCYFEITEQADALQECVNTVNKFSTDLIRFFKTTQPDEIIFVGCTSPYYIGKSIAYYWQSALRIPTRVVTSSEFIQFPGSAISPQSKKPLLVAISRSGKTSETIWAVNEFEKKFPGRTVLISCVPGAPLADLAALKLFIPKGMEETLAQTRSFSAMYMAAQLMCAVVSQENEVRIRLEKAPGIISEILEQVEPAVKEIFQETEPKNLFFIGSGPQYGIALDAALKMMEMSLSEVMCFPFLESRHGPKSIIGSNSLVVGLFSHAGQGFEAQVIEEFTTKHEAITVAITPDYSWNCGNPLFHIPVNNHWPDSILGLLYLPVVQLMAYYRAIAKDVNPDESRNLTQYIQIPRAISDI